MRYEVGKKRRKITKKLEIHWSAAFVSTNMTGVPKKKKINPQSFGEWKDSMQKDLDPVTSKPPTLERDVVASQGLFTYYISQNRGFIER